MSNDANRTLIVIGAAVWIVVMAVLIFFTWTADTDVIDRLGDFVEYLDAHNDDAGKLIVTLAALFTVVLALLLIIVEVAPEEEERELRVKQAGATTIVPAGALKQRLEEALLAVPEITAARVRVMSRGEGIGADMDITIVPGASVAAVTQEATSVVTETVQADLGLPVVGQPTVRVSFASGVQPVASSVSRAPSPPDVTPQDHPEPAPDVETRLDQLAEAGQPAQEPPQPYNPWSPPPPPAPAPPAEPGGESPQPAGQPPAPQPYNPWSPPSPPAAEPPQGEQQGEPENPQP